jgi:CBS domain-containing protein
MSDDKQYIVRDFMRANVVTAHPETALKDVVATMISAKTNGVVIVDADGRVVGILSGLDIIQYIVPDYLEGDRPLANFESGALFGEQVKRLANDPVEKFMTAHVTTVKPDDSIMEAATMLSDNKIRQLPVVDEQGLLIGYINRTDIKVVIGQILGISQS